MSKPMSRTVPALLDEQAEKFGDLEALVGTGKRYSYQTLRSEVHAFAKGLHALGVGPGSRVGILMGNRPDWIVADLAICSLGAVMISVNTWVTSRELEYILDHSDADTLIYVDRFLRYNYTSMLKQLKANDGLPKLKRFICLGGAGIDGSISFEEIGAQGSDVDDAVLAKVAASISPEDICYLLYTSGSTSTPKGVQLVHGTLIENMWNIGERMHVVPGDRLWLAISLYWGLGCENALFNLYTHGGCIVLQEHFDAGEALRIIEDEQCTLFYAMPNMAQALYDHPDRAKRDLSSLRSGATTGTPEQIERVIRLGVPEICHIYGLTETYGNCNVTDGRFDPPEKAFSSVGRPLEGVIQRVVDPETFAPCATGQMGEIQVKQYVTLGYYKDDEKNREAFTDDGFFRTGDLGIVDNEGFLWFCGRIKEMIKTGGINVAPAEVEAIIRQVDGVELAFVVGIPDPVRDEVIGAVVVTKQEVEPSFDRQLSETLRGELAAYKLPRYYRFLRESDLPLTATGKVHKNRLVELFDTAQTVA